MLVFLRMGPLVLAGLLMLALYAVIGLVGWLAARTLRSIRRVNTRIVRFAASLDARAAV